MEVDELPTVKADEVNNNETSSDDAQSISPVMGPNTSDIAPEKVSNYKEGVAPFTVVEFSTYTPSASTSKSKQVSASAMNKKIQEFIRILRPHLPRKAKTRANKMLQNIIKGKVRSVVVLKKKPKKRPQLKQKKPRQSKKRTKSLGILRRNNRSLCSSSDSCQSNTSCPQCGHSLARCRF